MSYEGIHPSFAELLLEIPNGASIAAPTDGWEVRLYSTLFDATGTATQLTTGGSAGYLPSAIPASSLGWNNATARVIDNASPILFPINSSVATPWETAIACAIGKKATSTSMLPSVCFFGKLDTGWSVPPGDRLRFPMNRFKVRMFAPNTNISEEFASKIISILQGAALNPPNSFYLGLGSQKPDVIGTIGEITALPRIPIPCTAGKWVAGATPRRRQNATVLEFPEAPSDLPKIKSFGLFSEPRSAGVSEYSLPWWFGESSAEKMIYTEDVVIILAGGISVGL
jgi:hypothetical protein